MTYRYLVHGSGAFPWDMCRYDRCRPVSNNAITEVNGATRIVTIEGECAPSVEKWAEYLWRVSHVEHIGFTKNGRVL